MKIISINSDRTESEFNVAFNVDTPPLDGVMSKISFGSLRIQFSDGLLFVRLPDQSGPLHANTIKSLNDKFAAAESAVLQEADASKAEHQRALQYLSKTTGLDVN